MKILNILIATWGSPWVNPCRPEDGFRWGEVTYKCSEVVGCVNSNLGGVKSRTSLPLLIKGLRPKGVLLLVCDTVACCDDLSGNGSYLSLRDSVKRKYEEFIKEILSSCGLTDYLSIVRVGVVPCIGKFPNGVFDSKPEDTKLWILYELMNFLINENLSLSSPEEELRVYLDLTHGVNYLPTLTYIALNSLLHHLAFSGQPIRLFVLNTDPFSKGAVNELRINKIEETLIHPSTEPCKISDEVTLRFMGGGRDALKIRSEELSTLPYFYASVHAGMPLATLTFISNLNLRKLMKEIGEYFTYHLNNGFSISTNAGKIKVTEKLHLNPQAEFILKATTLLAAILESMKRKDAGTEPTLRNLSKVTKIITWNQTLKEVTSTELHSIRKIVCEYLLGTNQKTTKEQEEATIKKCIEALKKLEEGMDMKELVTATGRKVGGFSSRNFRAHAGLEYNTIKVRATITLTYKEEYLQECKKILKNQ